jgi:hypothetical protein
MEQLPKFFAIKNDTDNPLWVKYISWLSDYARKNGYTGTSWNGGINAYYGVTDNYDCGNTGWHYQLKTFPEGTVELTLEQWDEAVNVFELPEKWYCVVTEENKEILDEWRKANASTHLWCVLKTYDCVVLSKHPTDDSYFCGARFMKLNHKLFFDYKEITTQEFIKYVLKQKEIKDTILKEGDIVELLDIKYTVRKPEEKWYLNNSSPLASNNEIFIRLGLNKRDFQRKILGYYESGIFPECYTAEDLTKFVTAIQEEILKQEKQMKNRKISASNAQRIINIACPSWKENLANKWSKDIVLGNEINVSEESYQEMRKACTAPQNVLFDEIFGKDEEVYPDGTPCLVRSDISQGWYFRYANGKGEFYDISKKSGESSTWRQHMKLDINNLPVNE